MNDTEASLVRRRGSLKAQPEHDDMGTPPKASSFVTHVMPARLDTVWHKNPHISKGFTTNSYP